MIWGTDKVPFYYSWLIFLFVVNSNKGQKRFAAAVNDSSLLPPIVPPGVPGDRRRPIDSILLNVAGRLLMLQQDPVNPYLEDKDVSETFLPLSLSFSLRWAYFKILPSVLLVIPPFIDF